MKKAKVQDFAEMQGSSGISKVLLANNMNIESLRTNDTLLYDEWKQIDETVLAAARRRLVGVQDLLSRNLTYSFDGLSRTVLGYQSTSVAGSAELSMDGISRTKKDRPVNAINYLPLPIISQDFAFSVRQLNESRNGGLPIDTRMAEEAARSVAETAEQILFQGASSYTYGGGTIYGYTDEPQRNTYTLTAPWDGSGATGTTILADVLAMKQGLVADRYYGDYMVYIPTAYETVIDGEFKAESDKSIRTRLLEISGIAGIKVIDFMPANSVIMVQMSSDVVRMVEGLPINTVQWDSEGGMQVNFKVMTILLPQIRHDYHNKSGVMHGSI